MPSKGNHSGLRVFNFVLMPRSISHPIRKLLLKLLAACVLVPAIGQAQTDHQRLLDTAIVGNGVLGGYLTASGEQVMRMQFGAALEVRRFAEDGTPVWWQRYSVLGAEWNRSITLSDGAEGAVMLGNATLLDPGTPQSRVELVHFGVDGEGQVNGGHRLQMAIDPLFSSEYQPVVQLVRGSEQAMFLLFRSTFPGDPHLLIAKRNADGSIAFVRGLRDGSGFGSSWGDPGTMVCADGAGGLYVAHRDLGASSTLAGRISASGTLLWMGRFEDPEGYAVSAYDIASSPGGDLLILGKMVGEDLPSGGMLHTISPEGSTLHLDRYQWDMGRRLYVLADGSMATVKEPWVYRLDGLGEVLWSMYFEDWVLGPHHYIFETTAMQFEHDRLWMQGVLRRVLIQFNTQRSVPGFMTHPVDSIRGCQWNSTTGFGSVSMDVNSLISSPLDSVLFETLDADAVNIPVDVVVSQPEVRSTSPFCDQAVGMAEVEFASAPFEVFPNPVERGASIELLDPVPGRYILSDAQGRILWQRELRGKQERIEVPISNAAAGVHFLRVVPSDGSLGSTAKVLVY